MAFRKILFSAVLTISTLSITAEIVAEESDTKFLGVLIYDGVLTSDVTAPLEVLGSATQNIKSLAAYKVVTIGPSSAAITTQEGLHVIPDFTIDDAPMLSALVVGSAYDMKPVLDNESLIEFVATQGQQVRWLASNCSGAYILAKAGLLKNRKATTYPGGELLLKTRHPFTKVVSDTYYVVDENLVTSNGGLVSYAAALQLLELMSDKAAVDKIAATLYYDRLLGTDDR